eukprot:Gregarina_sp_Poly_1__10450@NODE_759_length_6404_cov_52_217611_g560_i0_p4_GENE_NODE_759_length_6404_cov_52_217611_g560_i0NODE_759_length_6404_cov_52_217611_g560_i0_p4_ORF_typecomplete_len317_score34_41_NODE_759_length_6404_cov_52_217611_g560_i011792129
MLALESVPPITGNEEKTDFWQWKIRSERAARMVAFLPVCVWLAYSDQLNMSFTYLVPVIYVLLSALAPSNISGALMACLVAIPHGIAGGVFGCFVWYWVMKAPPHWDLWKVELVTLGIFFCAMLVVSAWKVHRLASALAIPLGAFSVISCYHIQKLHRVIFEGITFVIPPSTSPPEGGPALIIYEFLQSVRSECPWDQLNGTFALDCAVAMPDQVIEIDTSLSVLQGAEMLLHFSPVGQLTATLPIAEWWLKFYFLGRRKFGFFVPALVCTVIGCAFQAAAHCIPPMRFSRSLMRDGLTQIMSQVRDANGSLAQVV